MSAGTPFPPVPDLGQRVATPGPDVPLMVQKLILDSAGIQMGGRAVVETGSSTLVLEDTNIAVLYGPTGVMIIGVFGKAGGAALMVPWHAVEELRAAP